MGGVWRGTSTTSLHTVAGKADENGQYFVSGSRSSCGIRPSVPALAHEGESLLWQQLQEGWVLIRRHPGSLSTGSSAGRLFRRRLNVQSGHREVRRARREMHQAMPREKGNTEKVGMVTCCQESRGRRPSTQCNLLGAKSMGPGTTECTSAGKLGGVP